MINIVYLQCRVSS